MIKFGFEDFQIEFKDFSKNYKEIGFHVRRVDDKNNITKTKNDLLNSIVDINEDKLKSKQSTIYDKEYDTLKYVTDYFLPLKNLQYESSDAINYYSIGSSNTKQKIYFRLKFMIESCLFILDDSFSCSGSYASSFYSNYIDMTSIEGIFDDILEKELPLGVTGITEGIDSDYTILALGEGLEVIDFAIDKHELLDSLIGIEVYKFEQELI